MKHASVKPARVGALLLVGCLGIGASSVDAQSPIPTYLTQRDGKTSPGSISSDEALWATFVAVSTAEADTSGRGAQFLKSMGLSGADATALVTHILGAMDDVNSYAKELWQTTCADPGKAASSRAALANALQEIDSNMESRRAARIAETKSVISSIGLQQLSRWTMEKMLPNLTLVSVDHAKRLAVEGIDPAVEIQRFCSAVSAPVPCVA